MNISFVHKVQIVTTDVSKTLQMCFFMSTYVNAVAQRFTAKSFRGFLSPRFSETAVSLTIDILETRFPRFLKIVLG